MREEGTGGDGRECRLSREGNASPAGWHPDVIGTAQAADGRVRREIEKATVVRAEVCSIVCECVDVRLSSLLCEGTRTSS